KRGVLASLDLLAAHLVALGVIGKERLLVGELRIGIVGALDVGAQETREVDRPAARLEDRVSVRHSNGDAMAARVLHLGCDRALPDELVEAKLARIEIVAELIGAAELARGT